MMSVTGECWSRGSTACSVASLCRIMTSLLKMTSLTPETDSKTASPSPSRHLGLIWHLAHTELLTSVLCPTTFCLPLVFLLLTQHSAGFVHYRVALILGIPAQMTQTVKWCSATGEQVRKRVKWPQSFKCERLAGSDGGMMLQGIYTYLLSCSLFPPMSTKQRPSKGNVLILAFTFSSWCQPLLNLCRMLRGVLFIIYCPETLFSFYFMSSLSFFFLSLISLHLFHCRVPEAPVLVGSSHAARSLRRGMFLFQWCVSPPSASPILR